MLVTAQDQKARTGLSQYIARHPVSLNKIILYLKKHKYCTRQNIMIISAKISSSLRQSILLHDIIVELTTHIPPKHKHLIRYYGIYSSFVDIPDGDFEVRVDNKHQAFTGLFERSDERSKVFMITIRVGAFNIFFEKIKKIKNIIFSSVNGKY